MCWGCEEMCWGVDGGVGKCWERCGKVCWGVGGMKKFGGKCGKVCCGVGKVREKCRGRCRKVSGEV